MAHGKNNKKAQPYAQNPYGPPGSYTENKKEKDGGRTDRCKK